MTDDRFSNYQVSELVREITLQVLTEGRFAREDIENSSLNPDKEGDPKRPGGRPPSNYTCQLHLRILPDDKEWFRSMANKYGFQNGKLFNVLRQKFEQVEGEARNDFEPEP